MIEIRKPILILLLHRYGSIPCARCFYAQTAISQ